MLFVVTEDWYFVSHRLPLAVAARAAGYEVTVATRVSDHGEVIRACGLRLVSFEISRSSTNVFREIGTIGRLIGLYREERPDVVHHVAMKPVLYGSVAAYVAGVPHVVNAIAGMGWLVAAGARRGRWLRFMVQRGLGRVLRLGTVLVQNPDDARLVARLGVPESRIRRVAGSGVDLALFTPSLEPEGIPVVVLPARLLWDKGVGEFVAAARRLKRRGVIARFVLAGEPDPDNPSAVSNGQIAKWIDEGFVDHAGWVRDMPKLLRESHIVCLPSFYGEGIPKSLIEAAAAGRPIVTTDMPGCREIVHDGDNGLLVSVRDPEALAQALARLIGDPELRRRMGVRGRARAEQEFGLEAVIQQTLALYDEAAA